MIGVQAAISLRNESIVLSGSIGGATVWYKGDLFGCQTVISGENLHACSHRAICWGGMVDGSLRREILGD